MNDRELLERAAKAAGYEFGYIDDRLVVMIPGACGTYGCTKPHSTRWNPLTDDGDALRLAVKLRINVEHTAGSVFAESGAAISMQVPINGDHYAATRRAIVRAAAALGEAA